MKRNSGCDGCGDNMRELVLCKYCLLNLCSDCLKQHERICKESRRRAGRVPDCRILGSGHRGGSL